MNSGMRVLMTADAVGGVWIYCVSLCRGLTAAGCDVALVTLGPPPSDAQRAALTASNVSLIETDLALEWQDPSGRDRVRAARELTRLAREYGADIIHLNSYREASYDWSSPTLVVAHSCVRSWAEVCGQAEIADAWPWQSYVVAVRDGLRTAASWVAPTAFFRDEIARLYDVSPGNVIWNGSDVAVNNRLAKQPVIFSAGRVWDAAKNVQALLAAAPSLVWPVVIAGDVCGPDQRESELQGGEGAELLGALPHHETLAWMQRAAVFASAARYEPFGLGVLEAARCGCALVLSDIGSFRELWDGAALFVSNDEVKFVDQLNQVCNDTALQRRLQDSARRRSQRYSASAMTAAYLALYRGLVDSRSASTAAGLGLAPKLEALA